MTANHTAFPLHESTYYLIVRTAMHMKTALYRSLHQSGIGVTPEQWSVLCCLWEKEGLYLTEVTDKTGRDKYTISRIVNLLAKKGLVESRPDPTDKRRTNLYLTSKGRELQEPLTRLVEDFTAKVFQDFSEQDMEYAKRLTQGIVNNIEKLRL
ncbi:MarR family winged helix-turn-helix transcriptional regulator [Desulfovermiculus halophilus]|uniref:MarR family winged helix-turn-helix transcriptional regulator n=1 Tax=Desulfovermiculus halophilus TaxID=339722 RepID=UPI000683DE5A|nr:MarR family transcriptional regulator [Desulfovermiculus halophilus]